MDDSDSVFPDELSDEEQDAIDAICDRFELAWKNGIVPRIEEHVTFHGLAREVLLEELGRLDEAYRQSRPVPSCAQLAQGVSDIGSDVAKNFPTAICIVSGKHQGTKFTLAMGKNVIGRDPSANLPLTNDKYCSWRHVEIELSPVGCVIRGLSTKNGTRVDGRKIPRKYPVPISTASVVKIGEAEINFA